MATLIHIEWQGSEIQPREQCRAISQLYRWQEHQAPMSFMSAKTDFILTDLNLNTPNFQSLLHILKVNRLKYTAVSNIDLLALNTAIMGEINNNKS